MASVTTTFFDLSPSRSARVAEMARSHPYYAADCPFLSQGTISHPKIVAKLYKGYTPLAAHDLQVLAVLRESSRFNGVFEFAYLNLRQNVRWQSQHNRDSGIPESVLARLDNVFKVVEENRGAVALSRSIRELKQQARQAGHPVTTDSLVTVGWLDSQIKGVEAIHVTVLDLDDKMKIMVQLINTHWQEVDGQRWQDTARRKFLDMARDWSRFYKGIACRLRAIDDGLRLWKAKYTTKWEDEQLLTKLVPVS